MKLSFTKYRIFLKYPFGISRSTNNWYDIVLVFLKDGDIIGRGEAASRCILLSQTSDNLLSRQRLAAMNDSQDGFFLAEQDLKIRGPGDVLGTRQSGEESFRLADLASHSHLISKAIERGDNLLGSKTLEARQEIIGLLYTWNRRQNNYFKPEHARKFVLLSR